MKTAIIRIACILWVGWLVWWTIDVRPWEWGWRKWLIMIGAAIGILVIALLFEALDRFEKRKGIGEARFDSETGKQIKE